MSQKKNVIKITVEGIANIGRKRITKVLRDSLIDLNLETNVHYNAIPETVLDNEHKKNTLDELYNRINVCELQDTFKIELHDKQAPNGWDI